jgi:4-aminobutyrate aminotransferase-like enzyme
MGNGYPVAGLVVRPEIVADFGRRSRYFNTFGGNTVAVAVAAAVLDVIEQEGLLQNAAVVGAYLKDRLAELAKQHAVIGDVRAAGLFLGVEIVGEKGKPDAGAASRIVNALRDNNVLISATGPAANILKIRPPLVFTRENADFFTEKLAIVLSNRP